MSGYATAPKTSPHNAHPIQSRPARHAFILVGTRTMFMCHQLMADTEGHNFEWVMEVEFLPDDKDRILKDRKNGVTHYIANHDSQKVPPEAVANGRQTFFTVDIWNKLPTGKPAPPWVQPPWLSGVPIRIVRIVHFAHINKNVKSRESEEYILFGKGEEAHIYHSVLTSPEYGHIATLDQAPSWISPDQLLTSVRISIPELPWNANKTYCKNPLPQGRYEVRYFGMTYHTSPPDCSKKSIGGLNMDVNKTWWYSTRVVNVCEPGHGCPPANEIS